MPEAARGALREVLQPPERREKLLRGLIHPGTVIDRISRPDEPAQLTIFRPPQDGEDVLRVMDRRQEALAMSLGTGHRVIRGVAGSGKTLILVYRARLLARLFPGQRFLLTCYTRSLAAQLRVLLKQHRNIEVKNLHKLMYRAIHAAGLEPPDVRDEQRLADTAIEALQRFPFQRYRAVFVDEAQDLGTEALRFALALLQEPDGDFVVVADAAQNIFRRKFSWKQAGIRAAGRTQILRQNYRNTREILGFAYRFLMAGPELRPDAAPDPEDEQAVIPPESAARSGPAPRVWIRPDLDGEVGIAVRQTIRWAQSAPGPRHVAVLYANGEEQGRALRLYRGLVDGGLEVFWANQKTADAIGEAEEPVVLASVHAAKGLEFPRVVLCGLWRQEQDAESNRRLAYVGMTRAMDHLSVLTTEDNPLASDLRSALEAEAEAPP
jgi:superfamily I DNA/RNA helicase